MTIDKLLNDIQNLKEELLRKNQALELKDSQLTEKDSQLTEKDSQLTEKDSLLEDRIKDIQVRDKLIINLQESIVLLRRKKYAPSSEVSPGQDNFFDEMESILEEDIAPEEDESENKKNENDKKKKRGKRAKFHESLPRIDNIIEPDEKDKFDENGIELECIGEEISEQLKITPAKVQVIRNIRKKYKTPDKKIIMGEIPEQLLPKSMATSSLIAHIITAKYVDGLPLYRQEKIFQRIHADLNRQTMARWLIKVSKKLTPLYNLLQDFLLEKKYLHMDETYTQVLKEDGKKATSKSYMWVRCAPCVIDPIVLFDYAPSREGLVPLELLEGFKGALQVDGYDGYAAAIKKFELKRLGCMDHCRRKFFDASKTSKGKNIGKKGVKLIDKLYKIEKKIKGFSPEERDRIRKEEAVPLLEEIKKWINELRPKITPKSIAGKAINYAYNEWKYLKAYIDDPIYRISNILVENAIRPFAIGRKNWLFSASVDGANASAMFYSLIETAKANDLEPFDYLNRMLEKLPLAKSVDDFEKLLPLKSLFQG